MNRPFPGSTSEGQSRRVRRAFAVLNRPARANSGRSRLDSFRFAFAGVVRMVRDEPNARLHLLAACATVMICLIVHVSAADWRWIVLSLGLVFAAEAFNTGIEKACDATHPDFHTLIKVAKDVAAGGVLITALTSAAMGILTLYPYLCRALAASGMPSVGL